MESERPAASRPTRPTTYRNYLRAPKGNQSRGTRSWGNHFCNEAVVTPMPLAWNRDKIYPSTTVFRLLPGRNDGDPRQFDAYRYHPSGELGNGLGDHCRSIYAWRRSGFPKITFALYDQRNYPEGQRFDTRSDPFCALYWTCSRAAKGAPTQNLVASASMMLGGGDGRFAVLQRPTDIYLFRALVFEHGCQLDKDKRPTMVPDFFDPPLGLGEDEPVRLLEMTAAAGRQMLTLMDAFKPGVDFDMVPYEVDDDDRWSEFYEVPDPISFDRGVMFYIHPADAPNPFDAPKSDKPAPRRLGAPPASRSGDDDKQGVKGYALHYRPDYRAPDGQIYLPDLSDAVDQLRPKLAAWDRDPDHPDRPHVLKYLSLEEKVRLVSTSFRVPRRDGRGNIESDSKGELQYELLLYAWADYPEALAAIPDEIRREGTGRESVSRADAPFYATAPTEPVVLTPPTPPRPRAGTPALPPSRRGRDVTEDESIHRIAMPETHDAFVDNLVDAIAGDDGVVDDAIDVTPAGASRSRLRDAIEQRRQVAPAPPDDDDDVIDEDEYADYDDEA